MSSFDLYSILLKELYQHSLITVIASFVSLLIIFTYICPSISINEANASPHTLLRLFVQYNRVSIIFTPKNTKQGMPYKFTNLVSKLNIATYVVIYTKRT